MGFATLYIMLFHVTTMLPQKSIKLFDMGNVGVDIFLLLSGFGIYYSLSKERQTLKNFYKSRLRRIVLPYLVITIPFALCSFFKGDITHWHLVYRISGLTAFYEGSKWLWYMTIALFSYLLAPLFKKVADCNKSALTTIGSFIIFYTISRIFPTSEILWTRMPMFYLGMILGKSHKDKITFRIPPVVGFISLAIVFCISFHLYHHGILGHTGKPIMRMALALYSLPLSFCAAYVSRLLPTFLQKFLCWFGQYSFELYITHIAIILYFFSSMKSIWVYGITIFLLSVPLAYAIGEGCQLVYKRMGNTQ